MTLISRPMLASDADTTKLQFPVLATPKIDGIRVLKIDGTLVSRSFKLIRNNYLQYHLTPLLPDNADGEVIVSNISHATTSSQKAYNEAIKPCATTFYDTSSAVMSVNVECDFIFYWFDWVQDSLYTPYIKRMTNIEHYVFNNTGFTDVPYTLCELPRYVCNTYTLCKHITIIKLLPEKIRNIEELVAFEVHMLKLGFEGIIVRSENGPYKCGRSTVSEGFMLKIKQYVDEEATIIGYEQLTHNMNDPQTNAFGNIYRQTLKENIVEGNTLGSLIVKTSRYCKPFKIGSGFTQQQRDALWSQRDEIVGSIVKYKYMPYGIKDVPRVPVFLGIRDPDDIYIKHSDNIVSTSALNHLSVS